MKVLLSIAAIAMIIAAIIGFRLYAADLSLERTRERFDAQCEGDAACLAAGEAHHAACHEAVYDYHTHQSEDRRDPWSRDDGDAPEELDYVALVRCIDDRAEDWTRPPLPEW